MTARPAKAATVATRYAAGWTASRDTATYDLAAAERRHEERHGKDEHAAFAAGWTDYAAGHAHGHSLRAIQQRIEDATPEPPATVEEQQEERQQKWTRTRRRAPGEAWDDLSARRIVGAWHAEYEHGQTWCGKRPGRLVSAQTTHTPSLTDHPEGDVCTACVRAIADGRARPYRGKNG